MHPKGANRNKDDHAMFSNAGPYLSNPAETNNPKVIPNAYRLKTNKKRGNPNFNIDIPNKGEVNKIAGINPIRVLINAVKIKDIIISLILSGAINKFVKFLLQISSKKSMLKLMLDLNKKS